MSEQPTLYEINYTGDTKLNMYTRVLIENKQLVPTEPTDRILWCNTHKHMKCRSNHPVHCLIPHCLSVCDKDDEQHECDVVPAVVTAIGEPT